MSRIAYFGRPWKGKFKPKNDFDHKAIKHGLPKVDNTGVIKPHVYVPTLHIKQAKTTPTKFIKQAQSSAIGAIKNKALFKTSKKQANMAKAVINKQNENKGFKAWFSNLKKQPLKMVSKIIIPVMLLVMLIAWIIKKFK